jgi:IclR family acetate operon transcriptional repressor
VQAVERALRLLQALADDDSDRTRGIAELAEATGLTPPTVHRLMATLMAHGFVRQELSSRRYVLGPAVIRLGSRAIQLLGGWVRPYLVKVADATGESVDFALLEEGQVVYLAHVASPRHRMRMVTEVGLRLPPHATASGKVLLAGLSPERLDDVLERNGLPRRTEFTITDESRLRRELEAIAEQGFAVDEAEDELGVVCIAIPIRLAGAVVAAMSTSAPAGRVAGMDRAVLVSTMREVGEALEAELSGRSSP